MSGEGAVLLFPPSLLCKARFAPCCIFPMAYYAKELQAWLKPLASADKELGEAQSISVLHLLKFRPKATYPNFADPAVITGTINYNMPFDPG